MSTRLGSKGIAAASCIGLGKSCTWQAVANAAAAMQRPQRRQRRRHQHVHLLTAPPARIPRRAYDAAWHGQEALSLPAAAEQLPGIQPARGLRRPHLLRAPPPPPTTLWPTMPAPLPGPACVAVPSARRLGRLWGWPGLWLGCAACPFWFLPTQHELWLPGQLSRSALAAGTYCALGWPLPVPASCCVLG